MGFDGTEAHLSVSLPKGQTSATYKLQVTGAFAIAEDMAEWGFSVEEKYHFASPVPGKVKSGAAGPLRLYCGVPSDLKLNFGDEWPAAPDGMGYFGWVRFKDTQLSDNRPGDSGGRLVMEIPIEVE
jgi:hypothetical protein